MKRVRAILIGVDGAEVGEIVLSGVPPRITVWIASLGRMCTFQMWGRFRWFNDREVVLRYVDECATFEVEYDSTLAN